MERTFNSLRKKITSVVTVVFMMMSMIVIPSTANALFENDPLYGNDNWVFSDGTTLAIGFVNPERSLLSWAVAGANVVAYPANVMTNACDHIMETSGYGDLSADQRDWPCYRWIAVEGAAQGYFLLSQADDALLVYAVNAQINEKWLVATPAQQEVKYTPDDFYGEWFSSYDEPDGYVDHQTLSICQNRITVKGENNNGGREYVVRNLSWTCDANGCTVEGTISEVIKDGVGHGWSFGEQWGTLEPLSLIADRILTTSDGFYAGDNYEYQNEASCPVAPLETDFYGEWFSNYPNPGLHNHTLSICPDKITVKGESNIVLQQANVLEQARIGVNLLDQTRGVIGNLDSGFRINIAQDERTGNTREFVVSGLTWTCDVDGLCMIEGTISKIIDNKYGWNIKERDPWVSYVSKNDDDLDATYFELDRIHEYKGKAKCSAPVSGGGGGSATKDYCPNGDLSPSFYDGTCEKVSTSETGEGPDTLPPEIPVLPELSCPDGTDYSAEEVSAWAYAKQYGISTMSSACDARLHDYLTRAEMAKIAVQYIKTHLPERIPNLNKDCTKFARSIQKYKGTDLYDYMVEACQYEVMGIHTVDYTAVSNFMPDKFVTRAEFGTVFSRILRGNAHEGTNDNYYGNHLQALKEAKILTNIDANLLEVRSRVFIQLYRAAVENIVRVAGL